MTRATDEQLDRRVAGAAPSPDAWSAGKSAAARARRPPLWAVWGLVAGQLWAVPATFAQSVVTQGVVGGFTAAQENVVFPSVVLSPGSPPALVLLTNPQTTVNYSLTVTSVTGSNYSSGGLGALFQGSVTGFSLEGGGAQSDTSGSFPTMAGPNVTLTNFASLAGNTQTAVLPSGAAWGYSTLAGTINAFGVLAGVSLAEAAWGNGKSDGWSNGGPGGAVTANHAAGSLNVAPPSSGSWAMSGLPWQPYLSGLTAFSSGAQGLQNNSNEGGSGPGGAGGALNVTTAAGSEINLYDAPSSTAHGPIVLNGITALSQGGANGYNCDRDNCNSIGFVNYDFYAAGAGGAVAVTHNGAIMSVGTDDLGDYDLVQGQIGISATSLGGSLACPDNPQGSGNADCEVPSNTGAPQAGSASAVTVTLGSTGSILLTDGSAIGILAASSAGDSSDPNYNGTTTAGDVAVTLDAGAQINTGSSASTYAAGILAISTGSSSVLTPFTVQTIASGGAAAPGNVTVTNDGLIATAGTLSVGIGAFSVGGGGIFAQADPNSVSNLGSASGGGSAGAKTVNVSNAGSISTLGASAFGIVAFSGMAGGLVAADGNAVIQANGAVTSGVILGNSSSNSAGSPGGSVNVTNTGTLSTGDGANGGVMAIGVVAQSIGGGGGSAGGRGAVAFVGDAGGAGGTGGAVNVANQGLITSQNDGAIGILAQSVGGGGGNGGNSRGLFVAVGGRGGGGGNGGTVSTNLQGLAASDVGTITTGGDFAAGLLAQSIGGGGGNGGYAKSAGEFFSASIGGSGGSGGDGGSVDFSSLDFVLTTGALAADSGEGSPGVLLQSVGGGGGNGGAALTHSVGVGFSAAMALGGGGGDGGDGGTVNAAPAATAFTTYGVDAIGLLAQSIGGGGGSGGLALAKALAIAADPELPSVTATFSLGGTGGLGGSGGAVLLSALTSAIRTFGDGSTGLLAQSIGGGGGSGGDATAASSATATPSVVTLKVAVALGGSGSAGGDGSTVTVDVESSTLNTSGANAAGVLAQSIGGGGGNAGGGNATVASIYVPSANNPNPPPPPTSGPALSLTTGVGGSGGSGGSGNTVTVTHYTGSSTATTGSGSQGILAQSIGGGGGNAGGGAAGGSGDTVNVNVAVGGAGGTGNDGGGVWVTNQAGAYLTTGLINSNHLTFGGDAVGIFAQSIGGGGGTGGSSDAAAAIPTTLVGVAQYSALWSSASYAADVSIGGTGGASGNGGVVNVLNDGGVTTYAARAYGILAHSVGSGGGSGGEATSSSSGEGVATNFQLGGKGGGSGDGGAVSVTTNGGVYTYGYGAPAVVAQSVGGGGGVGGSGSTSNKSIFSVGLAVDGAAGANGAGGSVIVSQSGLTTTAGDDAYGVLAQSIGGGGGLLSAGCTNSLNVNPQGLSGSACLGNNGASLAGGFGIATSSFEVTIGGAPNLNTSSVGGPVATTVLGEIRTIGARAFGVVAQSIGGGGGLMTNAAGNLQRAVVQENPGQSNTLGGTVTMLLGGNIITYGNGAWGVLAQSIGGGGGFVGDPSLALGNLFANTLPVVCCGGNTHGADGGELVITSTGNITTSGVNAHGIVAQSIGGGGGGAAGSLGSTSAQVDLGNSAALYGYGSPVVITGQGGAITLNQPEGTIDTQGAGAVAILAQSSGNESFQSSITLTIGGRVQGGTGGFNLSSGSGASGIVVSGGDSIANGHGSVPNTINVTSTGSITTADGVEGMAIYAIDGLTNVSNAGTITGSVVLGDSNDPANMGSFTNALGATFNAGSIVVVSDNSLHNAGSLVVTRPTQITGSLKQSTTGELRLVFDNLVTPGLALISVSGLAQLAGSLVADVQQRLLPGTFPMITANSFETAGLSAQDSLLFDWEFATGSNTLTLSPQSDFRSAGLRLNANHRRVADYLSASWANADPALAQQFAYLSHIQTEKQYVNILETYSGRALATASNALTTAAPEVLGRIIDCPFALSDGALLLDGGCVWARGSRSDWHETASNDTVDNTTRATTWAIGGQREFSSDWYIGGSVTQIISDTRAADNFSSDGDSVLGSVAVKHVLGPWSLGGGLTMGQGWFRNNRRLEAPALDDIPGTSELLQSDSRLTLFGGRARLGYDFDIHGGYLRALSDLDITYANVPAFTESGSAGSMALRVLDSSDLLLTFAPTLELGQIFALGGGKNLRAFVNLGARVSAFRERTLDLQVRDSNARSLKLETTLTPAVASGVFNVGAQGYQLGGGFDLLLEYSLQSASHLFTQTGTLRLAYKF